MNLKNIIEAANITGADSIHPGFGFLSENSQFAKICEESNIKFIGPSYKVIELMGNKSNAKDLMKKAGVPVIPGSDGSIQSLKGIIETANKIGYPILLKASAGGGGKGIRIVNSEEELESNYNIVKQEAKLSFNNDEIYVEKFIKNPRHVEIQVLADEHGNVIHLGERDCSIQRKNQKVIEETPSTILDDKLRNKMGEAAIKAVKASSYTSCGTVEFLVDSDKNFYFMEMNTRIQVEHGVTEMVTGTDLVKTQILVAQGDPLPWKQSDIHVQGWAIECRINAEDPGNKFMPCPGKITEYDPPKGDGIRIDSCVAAGSVISPFYDSMIAKVIVHGKTRDDAIKKMLCALEDFQIKGIKTNINLQWNILSSFAFQQGKIDTNYLEEHLLEYI